MEDLLSEAWFDALGQRLATLRVGEASGRRLRLGVRVIGGGQGTVSYTVVLGAGEASELVVGENGAPEVVLVESYETAQRIAAGSLIAEELAAGAVKLEGDVQKLLAAQSDLAELSGLLSGDEAATSSTTPSPPPT